MSRLTELIDRVSDLNPGLADDLRREVGVLGARRPFGLNFERHMPESIQLPEREVRVADKVLFRPPRGKAVDDLDRRPWIVVGLEGTSGKQRAKLATEGAAGEIETATRKVSDLIVVADFRDPVYPGLRSTGSVTRGGDKPYHTVINGENYHVLKALTFVCREKVDCIYIDPPYNTRDKDWKYNNDYVDSDDAYRHSKWLAMMERRLKIARELLNPDRSVLVVSIDEKEYLRLGLLLEQTFTDCRIQMVSVLINPASNPRQSMFSRSDEYLFFVFVGDAAPLPVPLGREWISSKGRTFKGEIRWDLVMQSGPASQRSDSPGGFYPIYVDPDGPKIHSIGDALEPNQKRTRSAPGPNLTALWPIRRDGSEGRWRMSASTLRERQAQGLVRLGGNAKRGYTLYYLPPAEARKIEAGIYDVTGTRPDGSVITGQAASDGHVGIPSTQWRIASHDATQYGSRLLSLLIPGRKFPFPKSLYAVEDTLRFLLADNPRALVLDFFAGSGTTAHAVARLNKQDGGARRSISVTNNEVSAKEAADLASRGLRPGDEEWEALGICEYITKPRLRAAVSGETHEGKPISGSYKFADEFPIADGLEENVEFFELTYEEPERLTYNLGFEAIAPLLWLRAGGEGRRIESAGNGFEIASSYGVLFDIDAAAEFIAAANAAEGLRIAYVVTDDEAQFQALTRQLKSGIEVVRLYSTYLENARIGEGEQ